MEPTFGFVDLAGFSALTEAHGDESAADLVVRFTTLVEEAVAGEGRRVKTIGDAVLVATQTPASAVGFVTRLARRTAREPDFPVLRAGFHHGEAVERAGDVFGAAINLAARVAAHARGGQVLATGRVADAARTAGIAVTDLGRVALHNLRDPIELFALEIGATPAAEAVDPVCRMRVAYARAAGRLRVDGVEYWFCSIECAARFARDPTSYLRR